MANKPCMGEERNHANQKHKNSLKKTFIKSIRNPFFYFKKKKIKQLKVE